MEGLEVTVLLGITILAGALLAPRLRVAAPLLLLCFGLLLGFVPELRGIELPPETVLLLFLPVMLFWESLTSSLRYIRRDLRGIVLMSTLLVVATALAVAAIGHLMGLPWDAALILGAAVAPPDATAVSALGRMLPRRNFMLLKAESLTNDGTALVIYAIAVGIAVGGSYTPLAVTGLVLVSYVGGILAGVLVAGLAYFLMRTLRDSITINIALLLTPFAAFLAAEAINASGVLAVVVAGLVVAYMSAGISTAASRRQTESVWPLGSYLLNGALFVLVGLQVQAVSHEIDARDIGRLAVVTIAVWLTLLLVRFAFQSVSITLIRILDRRRSQRGRRMTYRARVVSTVAGFRGAVSLAIVLSVPRTINSGEALPGRDEIIFITAGVIVLTLLVQGPLLPFIVRWAKLPADDVEEERELRLAERTITAAARAAIDALADDPMVSPVVRERLKRDVDEHLAMTTAPEEMEAPLSRKETETAADHITADALLRAHLLDHQEYTRHRLAIIGRKREALLRLRRDGSVDDAVARQIQTRLDVEEIRLTGVEPID